MFKNIKNITIAVLLAIIGILLYLLIDCSYGRYCVPIIKEEPPPYENHVK